MPHLTTDDGVKLYYEETGKGIPIVFVHEFAGDYARGSRRCAISRATIAASPTMRAAIRPPTCRRTAEKYSQERARDDIRAVLDALKIDKAHIVGLSMGGFATLHFGFTYPTAPARWWWPAAATAPSPTSAPSSPPRSGETATLRGSGMAKAAEGYALGPTRVQFQNKDPRGWREFADQLAEHSTEGAALTMRGVQAKRPVAVRTGRQDEDDHGADADHDRRRGLAVHRAGRPDEEEHRDRRAGRDAECRPQHQSGGSAGL